MVNFVSKGFAGRTSDLEIVKNSGYLDKLKIYSDVFKPVSDFIMQKSDSFYETILEELIDVRPGDFAKGEESFLRRAFLSQVKIKLIPSVTAASLAGEV